MFENILRQKQNVNRNIIQEYGSHINKTKVTLSILMSMQTSYFWDISDTQQHNETKSVCPYTTW